MSSAIVWFRQDLRLHDNPALISAVKSGLPLIFLYIDDTNIENNWQLGAASKWWLHHSLQSLSQDLAKMGANLILRRGDSQAAGLVAVDLHHHLGIGDLQVAVDILQGRQTLQLGLDHRRPLLQLVAVGALDGELVEALGDLAADADHRRILQEDLDARHRGQFFA